MTKILARCPECHHGNELAPSDIAAIRYTPVDGSFYQFRCTGCGHRQTRGADQAILELLASGGVRILDVTVPARIPAPRIDYDDLIDLHEDLERL